jgi:hypothetical protein
MMKARKLSSYRESRLTDLRLKGSLSGNKGTKRHRAGQAPAGSGRQAERADPAHLASGSLTVTQCVHL